MSLHYMHDNSGRPHQSLTVKTSSGTAKRSPAMAAGASDRIWSLTDLAALLD